MKAATIRKAHLVGAIVWLLMAYPTIVWWKESVLWVAIMSLYTIILDHLGGWGAARAEEGTST
jgi:hypothetical protein